MRPLELERALHEAHGARRVLAVNVLHQEEEEQHRRLELIGPLCFNYEGLILHYLEKECDGCDDEVCRHPEGEPVGGEQPAAPHRHAYP